MRVLLDTHTFLWYVWDAPELSDRAIEIIEDPENEKLVSLVSVWEMAIKVSLGKLQLNRPFGELQAELIDANGFTLMPIEYRHTVLVSALPFHHKDPFDRLLIAQSLSEDVPLIGTDAAFDAYGVKRLW